MEAMAKAIDPVADKVLEAEAMRVPPGERAAEFRSISVMTAGLRWREAKRVAAAALDAALPILMDTDIIGRLTPRS